MSGFISLGWESLSSLLFPSLSLWSVIAAMFFIKSFETSSAITTHATWTNLLDGSFFELLNASIKFSVLPSLYWSLFVLIVALPVKTSTSPSVVIPLKSDTESLLLIFSIVFNFTILLFAYGTIFHP